MEKFNLWTATHKLQWENELDVEYEDVLRAIKFLGIKPEVPDDEHKSCAYDESENLKMLTERWAFFYCFY